jgi:ABC-2 type transport system ATP-binding protein
MIEFEDLTQRYRRAGAPVLDRFTWQVPRGRSVLLGPNGAGKTTLLAIGSNAMAPSKGRVRFGQLDPARRGERSAYRRSIAWMPQRLHAIPGLTCREQVAYVGWLKGMSRGEAWKKSLAALELVGLADRAETTVAHLSGGQLRRVGLAQCLVHGAQAMLLDEPTAGLDPDQRAGFREILTALPGIPVLVATHQVDDLADVFETVAVMDLSKIIWQGTPDQFLGLAPANSKYPGEDAFRLLLASAR